MATSPAFATLLAALDAELEAIERSRAEGDARRSDLQTLLDEATARATAAGADVAACTQQRDTAAAVLGASGERLAASSAAVADRQNQHRQAAAEVEAWQAQEPDPIEPGDSTAVKAAKARARREWLAGLHQLEEAERAAAAAVATAHADLVAAQTARDQDQASFDAAGEALEAGQRQQAAVEVERRTIERELRAAETELARLEPRRQEIRAEKDRIAGFGQTIGAEPIERPAVEAVAQSLAADLWRLRRERQGVLADLERAAAELASTRDQVAVASTAFNEFRREFDTDLHLHSEQRTPEECVQILTTAVRAAEPTVAEAKRLLDLKATEVEQHGA